MNAVCDQLFNSHNKRYLQRYSFVWRRYIILLNKVAWAERLIYENKVLHKKIKEVDYEPMKPCGLRTTHVKVCKTLHRYLALEGLCLMSNSEFSVDAVRKHEETVVNALKVCLVLFVLFCYK